MFERIRKEADLPGFRIHDARHTHAGLILSNNGSIAAVSRLLGHHDVSFTLRTYGHLSQRALEDASTVASDAIARATTGSASPATPVGDPNAATLKVQGEALRATKPV